MRRRFTVKRRAPSSGLRLTEKDAAIVKGMLNRGDRQHDVAAWFGVNGGRIAEIATGVNFGPVEPASPDELPPPGPYPTARQAVLAQRAVEQALEALATAEASLQALRVNRYAGR